MSILIKFIRKGLNKSILPRRSSTSYRYFLNKSPSSQTDNYLRYESDQISSITLNRKLGTSSTKKSYLKSVDRLPEKI